MGHSLAPQIGQGGGLERELSVVCKWPFGLQTPGHLGLTSCHGDLMFPAPNELRCVSSQGLSATPLLQERVVSVLVMLYKQHAPWQVLPSPPHPRSRRMMQSGRSSEGFRQRWENSAACPPLLPLESFPRTCLGCWSSEGCSARWAAPIPQYPPVLHDLSAWSSHVTFEMQ